MMPQFNHGIKSAIGADFAAVSKGVRTFTLQLQCDPKCENIKICKHAPAEKYLEFHNISGIDKCETIFFLL